MSIDIHSANATKAAPAAGTTSPKHTEAADEAATPFDRLLQGFAPPAETEVALDATLMAQPVAAAELAALPQWMPAQPDAESTALLREGEIAPEDAALWDQGAALDISSLVGQTLRMDQAGDAAMRNGTVAWAQHAQGGRGAHAAAQRAAMVGADVATVAAGVEALAPQPMLSPAAPLGLARAGDAAQAMPVAVAVAAQGMDSASAAPMDGERLSDALLSEGRVALEAGWQLEDPQAKLSPTLQRVVGQVEQWAAAQAGTTVKPQERTARSAAPGTEGEWSQGGVTGVGSGTRLTDTAVREAQQAEHAMNDAAPEAPVQDMRFWLQGKQQRAELTLDRDGDPVRVQVQVQGQTAHVTLLSDQASTRERLDASVAQLREMLAQQGVELTGVSVQAEPQSTAGQGAGGFQSREGDTAAWGAVPGVRARQAQVVVPTDIPMAQRGATRPASGVDLYA